MALLVQKFGGTSVGTVERIEAVADKVISYKDDGNDMVVVVSAMSGETNRLAGLAKQIDEQVRGVGSVEELDSRIDELRVERLLDVEGSRGWDLDLLGSRRLL